MKAELVLPVISTIISGIFLVIVARINTQNKPVKDLIKKTKISGDGSLVEALGILQKEYTASQTRHAEEIQYYVSQLTAVRKELNDVRVECFGQLEEKDREIARLKKQLGDHERRLDQSHIGKGKA